MRRQFSISCNNPWWELFHLCQLSEQNPRCGPYYVRRPLTCADNCTCWLHVLVNGAVILGLVKRGVSWIGQRYCQDIVRVAGVCREIDCNSNNNETGAKIGSKPGYWARYRVSIMFHLSVDVLFSVRILFICAGSCCNEVGLLMCPVKWYAVLSYR